VPPLNGIIIGLSKLNYLRVHFELGRCLKFNALPSIVYFYNRMSEQEKKDFEEEVGFKIRNQ
jgi:hypothetical protein